MRLGRGGAAGDSYQRAADLVGAGVAMYERLGFGGMAPEETVPVLRRIGRATDRLRLLFTAGTAELERAEAFRSSRAADMVGYVAQEFGLTPEAAKEHVVFGRQMDALRDTVSSVANGKLSFDSASIVAGTAAKMRPENVAEVESRLLERASRITPGQLRQEAHVVAAEVDAEVLRRDATRAREKRALRIGPIQDGMATISGTLTATCATELTAAIEPLMVPADRHDRRTAEQRRHDALLEICRGGAKHEVTVVATAEAMADNDGAAAMLRGLVPITGTEFDQILDGNPPVSILLKDAKGNLAYVGRSARLFSRPKKRALEAENPTCVFDGCSRPAVGTVAHHIAEFARGGETTINNGANLCGPHSDRVHMDGWAVLRRAEGGYRTVPPGHPDNPQSSQEPAEYRRRRREAILRRKAAKQLEPQANSPQGSYAASPDFSSRRW